jgi:4-hydroxy-3-polyprenylbenzoate decarboxylase
MGFDATTKWPEEGLLRPWPEKILMDPKVGERIDQIWQKLGIPK